MIDKPKRKRTPNRRRQFQLMIALMIILLIASFKAVSPQIDAWLATDPFTSQCHFDDDYTVAVDEALILRSIGTGNIIAIVSLDKTYTDRYWSPDRQYLVAMRPLEDDLTEIVVVSASGKIIYTDSINILNPDEALWSPNSQYLRIVAWDETEQLRYLYVLNVETGEIVYQTDRVIDFQWSPDGNHLYIGAPLVLDDGTAIGTLSWSVVDMFNGQAVASEQYNFTETGFDFYFVGWEDDNNIYFLIDHVLTAYDLENHTYTELIELSFDGHVRFTKVLDHWISFATDADYFKIVKNDPQLWGQGSYTDHSDPIVWIPNMAGSFLYYDMYSGKRQTLSIFDANTTLTSYVGYVGENDRFSTHVSPDGHYVVYLQRDKYQLYDLHVSATVRSIETFGIREPSWFEIDGDSYLAVYELNTTYLWNPRTDYRCKFITR